MIRGWGDSSNNPFDDDDGESKKPLPNPFDNDDDTESPPTQPAVDIGNTAASNATTGGYTPPQTVDVASSILDEAPPNSIPAQTLNSATTPSSAGGGCGGGGGGSGGGGAREEPGFFREWKAANARYEQEHALPPIVEDEEIAVGFDPLASPGNSSSNGSLSGWSVAAGMVDRDGVMNPFDVEDDDDDSSSVSSGIDTRSSSPRQGCFKRLGLSMVREEEEEDDDMNGNGFDDVDLEASSPRNSPTNSNSNSNSNTSNISGSGDATGHVGNSIWSRLTSTSSSTNGGNGSSTTGDSAAKNTSPKSSGVKTRFDGLRKASTTDRVLHELQTNPNLKFRVITALSMMLIVSCLLAVIVVTSTKGGLKQPVQVVVTGGADSVSSVPLDIVSLPVGGVNITDNTTEPTGAPTKAPSSSPTSAPTTQTPTLSPSRIPTYSPTSYPTEMLTTANPSSSPITKAPTWSPSFGPTTIAPTYSPSATPSAMPVTLTPTRDCNDRMGEFRTYSDKLRDCAWLDNGYNGAKSSRKDLNCVDSELGEACKYACRLYNGCIDYLLSALPQYSSENDISIGTKCEDKDGIFMSNGNVPRVCTWIEEDLNTAPAKKDLNCGTVDHERTELGTMCPNSCAGYNDCETNMNVGSGTGGDGADSGGGSDSIELVSPHTLSVLPAGDLVELIGHDDNDDDDDVDDDDDDDDDDDGNAETNPPTPKVTTPFPTTKEEQCQDKVGEFETHVGTLRGCRWLNRDSDDDSAVEKMLANCGITEIGENCMESCPCKFDDESVDGDADGNADADVDEQLENEDDDGEEEEEDDTVDDGDTTDTTSLAGLISPAIQSCEDKDGEFLNHDGKLRACRWINRDDVEEKKRLNCGMTEIGLNCLESCPCENEMVQRGDNFVAVFAADDIDASIMQTDGPTSSGRTSRDDQLEDEEDDDKEEDDDTADDGDAADDMQTDGPTSSGLTSRDDQLEDEDDDGEEEEDDDTADDGDAAHDMQTDGPTSSGRTSRDDQLEDEDDDGEEEEDDTAEDDDDAADDTSLADRISSAMESCEDKDGEFLNHYHKLRACRWINRDDAEEKKRLNCGITEIGLNCLESCPCENEMMQRGNNFAAVFAADDIIAGTEDISLSSIMQTDGPTSSSPTTSSPTDSPTDSPSTEYPTIFPTWSPTLIPTEPQPTQSPTWIPTMQPTVFPESKGYFADDAEEILELLVLADAEVSQRDGDENFGDSKRLNVLDNNDEDGRDRQTLLLFDLRFVAESFGSIIGSAILNLYSVTGSDLGGVTLKKMADSDWTEYGVTWDNMPGGPGQDEPVIAFLDTLDRDSWYEIDVTAAVRDALENEESHLGIRIISEDEGDVYFASKERINEPPRLVVDSRTIPPSPEPTHYPTSLPTATPTIELDCMDKDGNFLTHTEEYEPCSWLDVGNGSLKKAFNCQNPNLEAPMFCQASCSAYNGCDGDELHCTDMSGTYESHTGWTAECSWLSTGQGVLKLDQNCGTMRGGGGSGYPITELGRRCQATCGEYNGCGTA